MEKRRPRLCYLLRCLLRQSSFGYEGRESCEGQESYGEVNKNEN